MGLLLFDTVGKPGAEGYDKTYLSGRSLPQSTSFVPLNFCIHTWLSQSQDSVTLKERSVRLKGLQVRLREMLRATERPSA